MDTMQAQQVARQFYTDEVLTRNFEFTKDMFGTINQTLGRLNDYMDFNEDNVIHVEQHVAKLMKQMVSVQKRLDRKVLATSALVGFTVTAVIILKNKQESLEKRLNNLEKLALIKEENERNKTEANAAVNKQRG